MNNGSDKEIIRDFTEFITDLKIRVINPGLYIMDNEASTDLKIAMITVDIEYQLVPPGNHRANNSERVIQTFKNHFIAGLYIVDKYSHLQYWDRLLHQTTISTNFIRKSRTIPHLSAYTHILG